MRKPPLQRDVQGDASETAILHFTEIVAGNVEEYRTKNTRVCNVPFNSTNKYQVSIHETNDDDQRHLLVVFEKKKYFQISIENLFIFI